MGHHHFHLDGDIRILLSAGYQAVPHYQSVLLLLYHLAAYILHMRSDYIQCFPASGHGRPVERKPRFQQDYLQCIFCIIADYHATLCLSRLADCYDV